MFLSTLYYLLLRDRNPIETFSSLIQIIDPNKMLEKSIERAIRAVFIYTFKMFAWQFMFCWLTFSILDVELIYIPSVISGLLGIIPVASSLTVVAIPAAISLYFRGSVISSVLLVLLHLFSGIVVTPLLYEDIPDSHRNTIVICSIL